MPNEYIPVNNRILYLCERFRDGKLIKTLGVKTTMAGAYNVCSAQLGSVDDLDRLLLPGAKSPRKPHYPSFVELMNVMGVVLMKRGVNHVRVTRIRINANL
jgi:hypothetical protein